jgi:hypothetical protein
MKRILFLDHPQFTSATYYLWQGLKELEALFPKDLSVSSYPYIPILYDEDGCDLRSFAWFNQLRDLVEWSKSGRAHLPDGVPPFHEDEYLTAENSPTIARGHPWFRPKKENIVESEDQAIRMLRDRKFDAIVLGNSHRVPTLLLARLRDWVKELPPVIYYDAGERDELNEHWIHVFKPEVVFKQILTPSIKTLGMRQQIDGYDVKLYPLPLSSNMVDHDISLEGMSIQWLRKRSQTTFKLLQIFYCMGETWPERATVMSAIDRLLFEKRISSVGKCSYVDYHYILANSKMAVTMRGSGRDTTRYWEIPLYNTAMISDGTMGCIHPYPFEDKKTALFYRSIEELVSVVDAGISDGTDVRRVSGAGQEHLQKYHSVSARAVFFLDILNKEINFYDKGLGGSLGSWKAKAQWDGRSWEGPVV